MDVSSSSSAPRVKVQVGERKLRAIFDICDVNHDSNINKRELVKLCRTDKNVADFFGLPQAIAQEDGSRDAMERLFQNIDANNDREISWDEFRSFYATRRSVLSLPPPELFESALASEPVVNSPTSFLISQRLGLEGISLLKELQDCEHECRDLASTQRYQGLIADLERNLRNYAAQDCAGFARYYRRIVGDFTRQLRASQELRLRLAGFRRGIVWAPLRLSNAEKQGVAAAARFHRIAVLDGCVIPAAATRQSYDCIAVAWAVWYWLICQGRTVSCASSEPSPSVYTPSPNLDVTAASGAESEMPQSLDATRLCSLWQHVEVASSRRINTLSSLGKAAAASLSIQIDRSPRRIVNAKFATWCRWVLTEKRRAAALEEYLHALSPRPASPPNGAFRFPSPNTDFKNKYRVGPATSHVAEDVLIAQTWTSLQEASTVPPSVQASVEALRSPLLRPRSTSRHCTPQRTPSPQRSAGQSFRDGTEIPSAGSTASTNHYAFYHNTAQSATNTHALRACGMPSAAPSPLPMWRSNDHQRERHESMDTIGPPSFSAGQCSMLQRISSSTPSCDAWRVCESTDTINLRSAEVSPSSALQRVSDSGPCREAWTVHEGIDPSCVESPPCSALHSDDMGTSSYDARIVHKSTDTINPRSAEVGPSLALQRVSTSGPCCEAWRDHESIDPRGVETPPCSAFHNVDMSIPTGDGRRVHESTYTITLRSPEAFKSPALQRVSKNGPSCDEWKTHESVDPCVVDTMSGSALQRISTNTPSCDAWRVTGSTKALAPCSVLATSSPESVSLSHASLPSPGCLWAWDSVNVVSEEEACIGFTATFGVCDVPFCNPSAKQVVPIDSCAALNTNGIDESPAMSRADSSVNFSAAALDGSPGKSVFVDNSSLSTPSVFGRGTATEALGLLASSGRPRLESAASATEALKLLHAQRLTEPRPGGSTPGALERSSQDEAEKPQSATEALWLARNQQGGSTSASHASVELSVDSASTPKHGSRAC